MPTYSFNNFLINGVPYTGTVDGDETAVILNLPSDAQVQAVYEEVVTVPTKLTLSIKGAAKLTETIVATGKLTTVDGAPIPNAQVTLVDVTVNPAAKGVAITNPLGDYSLEFTAPSTIGTYIYQASYPESTVYSAAVS